VLGLAEGTLPGHHRDNSLLPDAEREQSSGELLTRVDRTVDEHRYLLSALAAAPERTVTVPRGDPRRGRTRLPSRWLSDASDHVTVDSFTAGLRDGSAAASSADFDLRTLLRAADAHQDPLQHELVAAVPELAKGFALIVARASDRFTRYDGNLGGVDEAVVDLSERIVSPTSLQSWATCPRQYFLGHVLGLGEIDRPEAALRLSHLDRGTIVHEILERFVGEQLAGGLVPSPAEPWSDEARERAHELADEVFAAFERTGITGKAVNWEHDQEILHADVDGALDLDDERRHLLRVAPAAVEMPFGLDGAAPVELRLPSGRTISFRGRADRVDRGADGRLAVIDYKTGQAANQRDLDTDPVLAGRMLQLPLYGLAARQRFGDEATPVAAHYWYVSSKGGFSTVGYELDDARLDRFVDVVESLAEGIEGGVFPAYPGEYDTWRGTNDNCVYCNFDRLCPSARLDEWERVESDDRVAPFRALDLPDAESD
jgi:RecB family exonuclease